MRKRGVQMAILGLACAYASHASAVDVLNLPGLEAPPVIKPAKQRPKRKKRIKRLRKPPPAPGPTAAPRLEPSAAARPGNYSGRFFTFKTLPDWKGPLAVDAGVKYVPPKGDASFTVRFIPRNHRLYLKPSEYRRRLRERGEIDNSHILDTIKIGQRLGSRTRYTTHVYGGEYLFGKRRGRRYNEVILVPVKVGVFLIHYEANYESFDKFRSGYLVMLKSLTLPPARKYRPEKYYAKRRHLLRPLIEETISKDQGRHLDRNSWYGNPYQFVFQLGVPIGATVSGRSLGGGRVLVFGGLFSINENLAVGAALPFTNYSGASAFGFDVFIRTYLMKQKPVTPYIAINGGLEQFKINGEASTGTVFSIGAGAAMRWRPTIDATLELRLRNSALDGKAIAGTVHSVQLLLGFTRYFGK